MAEQIQQTKPVQEMASEKPKDGQVQPVQKKSKWWLWVLILIIIGVGIYFWLR